MNIFGIAIFDSGIFLRGKIWQVFFGWLDLSRDFGGMQNNLKILGSAHVSHRPHSSMNKVQPHLLWMSRIARVGVSRVVRMTTRLDAEKITSDGMMNIHKHSISNVFIFHIISFNAFWKLLILGKGIFLGFSYPTLHKNSTHVQLKSNWLGCLKYICKQKYSTKIYTPRKAKTRGIFKSVV